ncbi:hypothetical protein DRN58_00560 [Thermococci archaeon]|nr:MAG: hypothetical protein DRN58_00560 [Thermococci archaeon]
MHISAWFKNFKNLFWIPLVSIIFTTALSFILKPTYKCTAGFMPILTDFAAMGAGSQIQSLLSLVSGYYTTPSETYAELILHEALLDSVITKNNLKAHYHVKYLQDAREILKERTKIKVSSAGVIELEYRDADKTKALNVVKTYLSALERLNWRLITHSSRSLYDFIKDKETIIKDSLSRLQSRLSNFQKKYKTIFPEEELGGFMNLYAKIKLQEMLLQTEGTYLNFLFTENYPLLKIKNSQKHAIETTLEKKITTRDSTQYGAGFYIPLSELPDLLGKYMELRREYEILAQYCLNLAILKNKAKLKSEQKLPTFFVISSPSISQRPVWPRKSRFFAFSIIFSILSYILLYIYFKIYPKIQRLLRESIA